MKRSEQQLHLVMDESDAPYRDDEYAWILDDDLDLIRFAKENGLEFEPESHLGKLSRAMEDGAMPKTR